MYRDFTVAEPASSAPPRLDFIYISLVSPTLRSADDFTAVEAAYVQESGKFKERIIESFFKNANAKIFGQYVTNYDLRREIEVAFRKAPWSVQPQIPLDLTDGTVELKNMILMLEDASYDWQESDSDQIAKLRRNQSTTFIYRKTFYPIYLPRHLENASLSLPLINDQGDLVFLPLPIKSRSQLINFGLRKAGRSTVARVSTPLLAEETQEQKGCWREPSPRKAARTTGHNGQENQPSSPDQVHGNVYNEGTSVAADMSQEPPRVSKKVKPKALKESKPSLPAFVTASEQKEYFRLRAIRDLLGHDLTHAEKVEAKELKSSREKEAEAIKLAQSIYEEKITLRAIEKARLQFAKKCATTEMLQRRGEQLPASSHKEIRANRRSQRAVQEAIRKLGKQISEHQQKLRFKPAELNEARKQLRKSITIANQRSTSAAAAQKRTHTIRTAFARASERFNTHTQKYVDMPPPDRRTMAMLLSQAREEVAKAKSGVSTLSLPHACDGISVQKPTAKSIEWPWFVGLASRRPREYHVVA